MIAISRLKGVILSSGQISSPSFSGDKKIEVDMFNNTDDKRLNARTKDLAWVISRMDVDE